MGCTIALSVPLDKALENARDEKVELDVVTAKTVEANEGRGQRGGNNGDGGVDRMLTAVALMVVLLMAMEFERLAEAQLFVLG